MKTLVIFDITEDKLRNKIGEVCKDNGLMRIQKSAFEGKINLVRREKLIKDLRKTVFRKRDLSVIIYEICDKDYKRRIEILK